MPNYRSDTSTTFPLLAGRGIEYPPASAADLEQKLDSIGRDLDAFVPKAPDEAAYRDTLQGELERLRKNLTIVRNKVEAWGGLNVQINALRRQVDTLTGQPVVLGRVLGDAPGAATAATSSPTTLWWWIGGGVLVAGGLLWWLLARKGGSRALGSVHDSSLNWKNPSYPKAKPAK